MTVSAGWSAGAKSRPSTLNPTPVCRPAGRLPAYFRSVHTPSRGNRTWADVTITSSMSEKALECSVEFAGPVSPAFTLSPLRRGGGDPCYLSAADGAIWRTSMMRTGPVTMRISRSGPNAVGCEVWGSGATEFAEGFPALMGADDDASGFAPEEPTIAAAHRRVPHLRLGRTGRVLEALIPAVIEQRVAGKDAFRAWRLLVTKFGSPAPGPAPARMRVAADRRGVAAHPVVGVPSRQRRSRPGAHARRMRAARRLAGAAGHEARRRRQARVDVAAGGRDMDRCRDRPARLRRCRRVVGRRLPPGEDGRLEPARSPIDDDAMVELLGTAAAASAPRGAATGGQRAGAQPAVRRPPGDPEPARDLTR